MDSKFWQEDRRFYERIEGRTDFFEALREIVEEGGTFKFDYLVEQVASPPSYHSRPRYGIQALIRDIGRLKKKGYIGKTSPQSYTITSSGVDFIETAIRELG